MTDSSSPALRSGHVGLNVSDLDRALGFYRTVFGFDLLSLSAEPGRRYAYLGRGGAALLTLWQQSDGRFQSAAPGLHHLAFEAAGPEEVARIAERLADLGARVHHGGVVPHSEGGSSGGVFFEDPDGIRLEVYCPEGIAGDLPAPAGGPTCGFF